MILLPWPLRIAGFLFTFVISLVNPLALIAITGYFFLNSLYSIYNNFTTKTGETRNIIPTIFALIPLRIKPDQPENTLWTLLLGLFTYDNPVAIDRLINREIQQGKELFRTKPVPPEVDGLAETLKNTLTRSLLSVPEGRLEAEPEDSANFEKFWPGVQIAGKDNLRQQSAMWQAMLMSAGLPNSKQIIIRGFIGSGGQKMSKSLGNVVDPFELVEKYGTDAVRYFIARELNPFEDSDFTIEKFEDAYTSGLVNGLGNTVARIFKMATSYGVEMPKDVQITNQEKALEAMFETRNIQTAISFIWEQLTNLDIFIQQTEPFKTIKTDEAKAKADVATALEQLLVISRMLPAFLPDAAEKISKFFLSPDPENIPKLFPRLIK
jgi:hypothetical protein